MRFVSIILAAGLVAGSAAGIAVRSATAQRPASAAASARPDIGTGERVLLVVAGEHATRAQAEAASDRIVLGDLRGFVVAASSDFEGVTPGRFLVVSAFRTVRGAAEFEALVQTAGYGPLRRIIAIYRGSAWIGLGQEANPDGSGPLTGPLAPGHPDRL